MKSQIEEVLLSSEQIRLKVDELGRQITEDYANKDPLFIGILKGAVMFVADLMRAVELPLQIDFMAVSSYGSATKSSGVVRILKDLDEDIRDRHVLLVEDILDTGLTLTYLLKNLRSRQPASLEICSLLVKKGKQPPGLVPRYVGFEIPDTFVVGYGLDYEETFRNLPFVAVPRKDILGPSYG